MVSHRVTFEFDSGAKIVGYVGSCLPAADPCRCCCFRRSRFSTAPRTFSRKYEEYPWSRTTSSVFRSPKVHSEPPRGRASSTRPASQRERCPEISASFGALLALAVGGCAGPSNEIVEDRFYIAERPGPRRSPTSRTSAAATSRSRGRSRRSRPTGSQSSARRSGFAGRSFGRQPTVLVGGPPAAGSGPDARRGHRRARPAVHAVRLAGGRRQQRGRQGGAPDPRSALCGGLAPGSRPARVGRGRPRRPDRRGRDAGGGARCWRMSADGRAVYVAPTAPSRFDVIELPAPGGPKSVYRLDVDAAPVLALAAASRARRARRGPRR